MENSKTEKNQGKLSGKRMITYSIFAFVISMVVSFLSGNMILPEFFIAIQIVCVCIALKGVVMFFKSKSI